MSAGDRQYGFLQTLTVNDQPIAVESVLEMAYIENADIGGTKLILTLEDSAGVFRDNLKVTNDSKIVLTLADMNSTDEVIWQDSFVVAKASTANNANALKLECFQSVVNELKKLVAMPRFFVNKTPTAIIKELVPDIEILSDEFSQSVTYHLNVGATKSRLIRQICRDHGAVCFFARGKLHFKKIKAAFTGEPTIQLGYWNPLSEHEIKTYKMLGYDGSYSRIVDKSFIRWDSVKGIEMADTHKANAKTLISCTGKAQLNNQSLCLLPVMEAEAMGFGGFLPMALCGLEFYKQGGEVAIDESIPTTAVISRVTHYVSGMRYLCRFELSVSHE